MLFDTPKPLAHVVNRYTRLLRLYSANRAGWTKLYPHCSSRDVTTCDPLFHLSSLRVLTFRRCLFCRFAKLILLAPTVVDDDVPLIVPPGKPEGFTVVDADKTYIKIAWKPPMSDGNAPISKYVIQRREKQDKDWYAVGQVLPDQALELTDTKVVENHEYYYRVFAVNKAGPGEPCDCNRPSVMAKAKQGQFWEFSVLISD